jgi:hypothetical protein
LRLCCGNHRYSHRLNHWLYSSVRMIDHRVMPAAQLVGSWEIPVEELVD